MKIKDVDLKIMKADITKLPVDAIVNSVGADLAMKDGLAAAIRKKAGEDIVHELMEKAPLRAGEVAWTKSGGLKASSYIIHAVAEGTGVKVSDAGIRQACANALQCAVQLRLKSVAFPPLGCKKGDLSPIASAKIMAQEILKFLKRQGTSLKEIIICSGDEKIFHTFDQTVSGYVHHIQDKLGEGPYVTVDAIIEIENGIVLIERSNPPYGWALPGGFVDYGESLEQAVCREAKEETNLELVDLKQFHTYSDPGRDPRFHTVATVFTAKGKGTPRSGDDAKGLKIVQHEDLPARDYAFDHKKVIEDYLNRRKH